MHKSHNRVRKNNLTSIAVSKENHRRLKSMGQATESMNDVLTRLIKHAEFTEENED